MPTQNTALARSGREPEAPLPESARPVVEAVLEAIGIPYGAAVVDEEARKELLAERVLYLKIAVETLLDGRTPQDWILGRLRKHLEACPVTYRTDYAEVLADLRKAREAGQ